MQRGLAGMALLQFDLITGMEAAEAAGYDVMELWANTITAYLDAGHTPADLATQCRALRMRPISIAAVDNIDLPPGHERGRMIAFCRRMCEVAQGLGCPNIQMISGASHADSPWPVMRKETAKGLGEMADIAAEYGLRVAYEPLAWRPIWSVTQAVEIIQEAGRPNVGLLVDAFHAFAGGDDLNAIRTLDPGMICTVHLGDSSPRGSATWSDEDRVVMPGDGIVPLRQVMSAILETGYDGPVSDEFFPTRYADWTPEQIARTLKAKGDAILASLFNAGSN